MRDASRADVEASMTVWAEEVMKAVDLSAEIRFYDNLADIRRDVESGRVNFVVADGTTLIRHFAPDEFADGFGGGGTAEASMVLVARKGSGISGVRDLAGKRVLLLSNNEISELLMDTLCLRHLEQPCAKAGVAIETENRSQQLLLKLFFGKADAALVRGYALEVASELNPQIRERTQVIERFSVYGGVVGLFSRRVNPALREYTIEKVPLVQKNPRGQQILQVMQTDKVVRYPRTILDPIRDLMREHSALLARQGVRKVAR
jgi:ABC-type amino acid transport substrate-binding protein